MIEFWRRYRDGAPEYLARNYWWAYLNSAGVWFFDHYLVINSILFGQYRNILDEVMRRYSAMDGACTLQLACAYGSLTPALAQAANTRELHLLDVAAIQLRARHYFFSAARTTRRGAPEGAAGNLAGIKTGRLPAHC
ncbi:MAG: type 11 methyltransferase [Gallionellaceae bacterium]|nr:MAG: type 11 methyltransferase [Gallionellaceae bacterium]